MESNKQKLAFLVVCIFLVLTLALSAIVAAKKNGNNHNENDINDTKNNTNKGQNKMTYGRCVANLTIGKNSCFAAAKEGYRTCRFNIKNMTEIGELDRRLNRTEIRNGLSECRNAYKEEIKACKEWFKLNKESCGQYKCKENEVFVDNACMIQEEPEEPGNETGGPAD